jgi:L-lactate dehydrogenase
LEAAGVAPDRARIVAAILVEGDLLGQTTHGLAQLPKYLEEISSGGMAIEGDWEIIADHGANLLIDARRLLGPWIMQRAVDLGLERSDAHGVVTISIQRAHHIAALSAYLPVIAQRGKAALLLASDPTNASVAPFGGTGPIYSPNPIAAVFPTSGDPVLIDISTSATTMGLVGRRRAEGRLLDHDYLFDARGQPSRDPAVMTDRPRGSVQPLGGLDNGHKGYALGLIVEALANALSGHGRSVPAKGWGTSIFLQIIDPTRFGGAKRFVAEMDWMANAVASNPPVNPDSPARLPGQRALDLRHRQLANGVVLYPSVLPALMLHGERLGVPLPASI